MRDLNKDININDTLKKLNKLSGYYTALKLIHKYDIKSTAKSVLLYSIFAPVLIPAKIFDNTCNPNKVLERTKNKLQKIIIKKIKQYKFYTLIFAMNTGLSMRKSFNL